MYRIIDSRSSGKTSRLMLIAKENDAIFVCSNPHSMEEKAKRYGIVGLNFMDYNNFFVNNKEKDNKFVIDEIENFIKYITTKNKFIGYTLSNED